MKNVYTVKFEFLKAFSTARKAIEFAKESFHYGDWKVVIIEGGEDKSQYIQNIPTEKLITLLRKKGWLQLKNGVDYAEIDMLTIQ